MRRWRLVAMMAAGGVAFACCVLAAGLFWPAPGGSRALACRAGDGDGCVAASGRVLYVHQDGNGGRIHALLLSRRSLTLPGLVAIKLPALPDGLPGLAIGRWVSVVGSDIVGSHGRHDIHVVRLATAAADLRCRWDRVNAVGCNVRRASS